MKTWDEIAAELQAPFDPKDVHWRVGQAGEGKNGKWLKILAYIDNRHVQDRLDRVVGPENWQNKYESGANGGLICGIGIRVNSSEWVFKWDGAENTDIEAVKGGLSDAMKRAAVQWGIGRYLYGVGEMYADVLDDNAKGEYKSKVKIKGNDVYVNWNVPAKAKAMLGIPTPPAPAKQETPAKKPARTAPEKPGSKDSPKSGVDLKARIQPLNKLMKELGAKTADDCDLILLNCRDGVIANPTWAEVKENPEVDVVEVENSVRGWLKANGHLKGDEVINELKMQVRA